MKRTALLREIMWAAMLSVWLSFEGLLRPGETEQLLVRDLCFPDQHGGGSEGLVVTIRKLWHTQFVLIRDRALISWLRWWTTGVSTNRVLFRVSRRRWAKVFGQSLAWLQLDDRGFTLGSLRAGGATWHFKTHENLARLQFLGRWSRAETLRHYLHEALVETQSRPEAKAHLAFVLEHVRFLEAPPPAPLSRLLKRDC